MPYQHITAEQRTELGALLSAGLSQKDIANQLGKHRSSIWRERTRNKTTALGTTTLYRADDARRKTTQRRVIANQRFCKIEFNIELQKHILEKLKLTWTPEQIAGTLQDNLGFTVVCSQTIYEYIYTVKPLWIRYLRRQKNKYRRRHGTKQRVKTNLEAKKKRIDTRPAIIELRSRIGDWEGDTIVGKERTKRILTYVDRTSGKLLAVKLETATAKEVREKTKQLFQTLPENTKHTITLDNGSEFADHELMEKENNLDIYFAYPYHSWERGTNENTNGLLRQFFPKGSPFASITKRQLNRAVRLINLRPRKRHHYQTPEKVFSERCTLD